MYTTATFDAKVIDLTKPVGSIAASASVESGTSLYSVPIQVPPGTNGVAPSLGLVYSSSGGNGMLGKGWGLSGLSMISVTSKSIYFDGGSNPIGWNVNDKFVLDGVRMIGKTGTYGSDLSTYVLESENFASITSYGVWENGPGYFKVVTKDGLTMEYGNTSNSRQINNVAYRLANAIWRLNKIIYNDGNYIEFKYLESDSDVRIDEINYTGNTAAGLLPYNKVKFSYSIRSDVNTSYLSGMEILSKYLLDKITITTEGNIAVKSYQFSYGNSAISTGNSNSYLVKMEEVGSDATILNATVFKYGDEPTGFQPTSTPSVNTGDIFPGDYNGDGVTDLLAGTRVVVNNEIYYSNLKVWLRNDASNTFTNTATKTFPSPGMKLTTGVNGYLDSYKCLASDYTGDGVDDFLAISTYGSGSSRLFTDCNIYKCESNGTLLTTMPLYYLNSSHRKIHSSGKFVWTGDFNGDGLIDILLILGNSNNVYNAFIRLGNHTSSNLYFAYVNLPGGGTTDFIDFVSSLGVNVIDQNGDGKSDLQVSYNGSNGATCTTYTFDQNTYLLNPLTTNYQFDPSTQILYYGDFNGDKNTDVLYREGVSNTSQWKIAIGAGNWSYATTNFTFGHIPSINTAYFGDKLTISDVNGDGKMDIIHGWNIGVTSSTLDVYYNKGDNNFSKVQSTYSKTFNSSPAVTFDFNGDGRAEIINMGYFADPFDVLYFKKNGQEHLLQKVKNGHGHETEFVYKLLNQAGTFYNRTAIISVNNGDRLLNVQIPMFAVSDMKVQNGIGGIATTTYSYEDAKLHVDGKGLLGFAKITEINPTMNTKTVVENEFKFSPFSPSFFIPAVPKKVSTYLNSSNTLLSETILTNTAISNTFPSFFIKTNSNTNNVFEGRTSSTTNTYDNPTGNITQSVTNNNNVETVTTTTTFAAFGTPIASKLTSVTVSNIRTGQTAYSITTGFGYNTLGQLTSKTDFSGGTNPVVTTYGYNNMGNPNTISVAPNLMTARTSSTTFDSKGRYPVNSVNPLTQTAPTVTTYDPKWGKPLSTQGINGLTTTFTYDAFGRLLTTSYPTGYTVTESYGFDVNATEGTVHFHKTTHPGKPDVKIWYDVLDRAKKSETEGFQNLTITLKTTYDAKGNVWTTTSPYKTGETILTTTNTYDTYNRMYQSSNALNTTTLAYAYVSGNLTTTTSVNTIPAQVTSKTTDATGKTITANDDGGTLSYTYFSHGKLKNVKNGTTTLVACEYNDHVQQSKLTDINAGITQYGYNTLDEMTSQVSAMGQNTIYSYNALGQTTSRAGPEGTTNYYYSTSGVSINKPILTQNFTGSYEDFNYDAFGRSKDQTYSIDGISHKTTFDYNIYSDLKSTLYVASGFEVKNEYDANGYLLNVKNGSTTSPVIMWTNTGMNGFNQITNYTKGNTKSSTNSYNYGIPTRYLTTGTQDLNMTWDYKTGNLLTRNDAIKVKTETFTYDNLNRLSTWQGTGQTLQTMAYALNGNIQKKPDASTGNYGYSPTKINAVTNIPVTVANISLLAQNISYTPFFQPNQITENNFDLTYIYASDYQRIKGVMKQNGSVIETRYYFGSYEKQIVGGITRHIHYVNAGNGLIAIVTREAGVDTYNYVYTDHLGSILTVTNNTGAVTFEQNFDAWGRVRHATTWAYTGLPTAPVWLYRGYTAHEHLMQFGLINMNGRMYDPVVGRMLNTDNNVQANSSTQGYNRYSYVMNNPLKYNDPSGEYFGYDDVAAMVIGGSINLAANWKNLHGSFGQKLAQGAGYFGIGAAAGVAALYVGPYIAAGMAGAGAITTGVAVGLGGGAIGGFITGSGNSAMRGNNWKDIAYDGMNGAITGAIVGGVMGGVGGAFSKTKAGQAVNEWLNEKLNRPVWPRKGGDGISWDEFDVSNGNITGESPSPQIIDEAGNPWNGPAYDKPYSHGMEYEPRVRARFLEEGGTAHNFPYSFDDHILATQPAISPNGYRLHKLQGTMNSNKGWFEIGVLDGVIIHRTFSQKIW